jgi:hypothetical protein
LLVGSKGRFGVEFAVHGGLLGRAAGRRLPEPPSATRADSRLSRQPAFHHRAHRRFRELLPTILADRTFDPTELDADRIAAEIAKLLGAG